MNDNNLRTLLKNHSKSVPQASPYEWQKINQRIDELESRSSILDLIKHPILTRLTLAFTLTAVILFSSQNFGSRNQENLEEYLFSDSYFESIEENQTYAWID